MKLYLIRHGKTFASEQHLYCGSSDIPLSENGIKELQQKHYNVPKDAQFVTSGMLRTNQTLHYLFGDVKYAVETDLREIDFGIFELKSYEQLKDDGQYQQWLSGDNFENVPPKGESGAQMTKRVVTAIEKLLKTNTDTVVIAHGGVIAAVMAHLFPQENKNIYQWQPKQGCGYLVEAGRYTYIE
ncbi:MAG: histidine phosphatase family protein [Oscillospiraceae bacterium]|nr:histidine phosphatase family protein [Oscillospiraceae bacterium]